MMWAHAWAAAFGNGRLWLIKLLTLGLYQQRWADGEDIFTEPGLFIYSWYGSLKSSWPACYRLGGKTAAVLRSRTLLSYCTELLVCTYCKFYYAVLYHCDVFCKKLTAPLSLWEMYNKAKNNSCSLKQSCCLFILPKTRWASGEKCKSLELDFWYFYHPKSLDIMELNEWRNVKWIHICFCLFLTIVTSELHQFYDLIVL